MTPNQNVLYHDRFDSKGFTNENSLSNALLTKPDSISSTITYLAGRAEDNFPLHFMTEGQKGGMKTTKEINDIQYEWSTYKRLRKGSKVDSSGYTTGDYPGIGRAPITVVMEDGWLIPQYLVVTPDETVLRCESKTPIAGSKCEYTFKLFAAAETAYLSLTQLVQGTNWVMEGGAPVSESFSMGNRSNIVFPGKMRNQISVLRKSYHLGGNTANKTVEVKFNVNNTPTSLWIDQERWQHQMNWRYDCEEHYWYSKYNRNAYGVIMDKDEDSGLPIPSGAGIDDQITNEDTYSVLTAQKIKNTVLDVTYGAPDAPLEITLFTGVGGAEEFHNAMLEESGRYGQIIGDKFISEADGALSLGKYFNRYRTPQGHIITVKLVNLFDYGSRAENARKHPISGLPITSYNMYFVDQSMYEGERNILMVTQKGRSFIEGIEKGMAAIYTMNGMPSPNNNYVSTEQDKSSVHYMAAKGVCIRRNTHCFKLKCTIS